jgi:hypothetical protein
MRWLQIAVGLDVAGIVATAVLLEPTPTLLVPALAALAALVLRGPAVAKKARIGATTLLGAFALLGLSTAGLLFVPAALAMGAAEYGVDLPVDGTKA